MSIRRRRISSAKAQPPLRQFSSGTLILHDVRNAILALVLMLASFFPLYGADRDLPLARLMLEDAIIRDDVEGIELARGRLLRIAAESEDRTVLRDTHYLAALSALFEGLTGEIDIGTGERVLAAGIRNADRAVEIDPQFADGWLITSAIRNTAKRYNVALPPDPAGTPPDRVKRATDIDPNSPAVAFFTAARTAANPNGEAPASSVTTFDDLAARLDAERIANHRPVGLWDIEAHLWQILVRRASDQPRTEVMRPFVAKLLELRPDFARGQQIADVVTEHHFVPAPAVTWQPFLVDPAGDGKNPQLPDVIAVDRAEIGDRVWYRVAVHDALPRSFGVNVVVNRSGDMTIGTPWWGKGSNFRFDRLATLWISRDGDRYFGTVGVTDPDGVRGSRMTKIPADIQVSMGPDDRTVMIGIPHDILGLTDASKVIVAVGSHLVWNDDASTPANSR